MLDRAQIKNAMDAGGGLLRLEPSWVPRSFMIPGERLKLHPRDLYALGGHRGGINERWFSSTTNADNGPGTPADEGLSYVRLEDGSRFPPQGGRRDRPAISCWDRRSWSGRRDGTSSASSSTTWGRFPITCTRPTRRRRSSAARESRRRTTSRRSTTRPTTTFPHTFMGLEPGTTKADVRRCLENWNKGDNGILFLSRAFRLEPGTGWQIDPGILHAPGVSRHLRAAGRERRLRDVPVRGRRAHHALGADDEGRPARVSPGPRLSGRAARLGRERQPDLRRRQSLLPQAGETLRADRARGLSRAVDHLWHGLVLRQGAHGPSEANGDDHRRRRLRHHPHARLRTLRHARRVHARR